MRKDLLCRRDILKGSAASRPPRPRRSPRACWRRRRSRGHHARARRGGHEGRQGRLLHGHGHPRGRAVRQDLRGEISRHRRARRALGLGAALPAHRAGARQQHQRRRCRQQRGRRALHRLEAQRLAGALSPGGGRASTFPPRYRDADGMLVTTRVWLSSLGYNTNLVKAEEAPKSFADLLDPKWTGKMIKAHPGLQRHHHDRHVPDRARARLGVLREARPAEGHAGAVLDRPAQEAGAGRARGDGRRQRLQPHPAQGAGRPGRGRLSDRGHADRSPGPTGIFRSAPNPNAARLFHSWLHAPRRSSCWSTSPPSTRCTRRSRRSPAAASSPTSSSCRTTRPASRRRPRKSRPATARSSRCR